MGDDDAGTRLRVGVVHVGTSNISRIRVKLDAEESSLASSGVYTLDSVAQKNRACGAKLYL
jgi:hypothetical protein